jgi:integrase
MAANRRCTVLSAKGLSARRVAYVRVVLQTALNRAWKWQLLPRNPVTLTDPPRWIGHHVTALTEEHARLLLTAFDASPHGALYATALALGLRRGELLGLRWMDIDLDAATATIYGQVQRIDGAWQRVEPKTGRSRRTLPPPQFLVERLRAWRLASLEKRLAAGPLWQDFGLVFPSERGTPHDGGNVSHRFARFLKSAELSPMRFHDLRHGTATLLLAQGVDLRTIAEILGHSQISITANLYSHVSVEMKRRAASAMDAVMGGG